MAQSIPKPCIFNMYEDDRAYKPGKPFFLKIGPYRFWTPKTLEEATLDFVLARTNKSKEDLANAMTNIAMDVKEYFEGANLPLDGFKENDKFVMRMVRDGCFVLEAMHTMATEQYPLRTLCTRFSTAIHAANTTMLRHILLDLLSVVNQVPLPFLRCLYDQLSSRYGALPFEDILNKFLNCYPVQTTFPAPNLAGACHLLDAARMKLLPKMFDQTQFGARLASRLRFSPNRFGEMSVRFSALDLKDSGVTISQATEGTVRWEHRRAWWPRLKLPHILINRDSLVIFKNMVAYEQRIAEDDNRPMQPVSSYLRLLSDLLLSVNDGRALISRGIIDNQLGSVEELVKFVRDLNLRDTYGIDMLSEVRKMINEHCQRKWIRLRADLKRTYFRSPWAYWTFAGAIVLLVLTSLQVIYAILAYHRPPN